MAESNSSTNSWLHVMLAILFHCISGNMALLILDTLSDLAINLYPISEMDLNLRISFISEALYLWYCGVASILCIK